MKTNASGKLIPGYVHDVDDLPDVVRRAIKHSAHPWHIPKLLEPILEGSTDDGIAAYVEMVDILECIHDGLLWTWTGDLQDIFDRVNAGTSFQVPEHMQRKLHRMYALSRRAN